MATRPIFLPLYTNHPGAQEKQISFKWFPGMAAVQKKKSIKSMHEAAQKEGISPILEISSKSPENFGVKLSAFNLMITTQKLKRTFSVEVAFQASKVFDKGGPYTDLLNATSREAKKDSRIKNSGNLINFIFYQQEFSTTPRTFFYDWLYINALNQNSSLANYLLLYKAFTDIEFNPKKSINCQAYSAAIYVSLVEMGLLKEALSSPAAFLQILEKSYKGNGKRNFVQKKIT